MSTALLQDVLVVQHVAHPWSHHSPPIRRSQLARQSRHSPSFSPCVHRLNAPLRFSDHTLAGIIAEAPKAGIFEGGGGEVGEKRELQLERRFWPPCESGPIGTLNSCLVLRLPPKSGR
jgi:hypothetical protein